MDTKDLKEGLEPEKKELEEKETTPEEVDQSSEQPVEEDMVEISKSELEQLRKDSEERDNLSKAVTRLNRIKGRTLPTLQPAKETKTDDDYDDETTPKGDFITRQDFRKMEDRSIIGKACENPEIDENWDEILVFYTPPSVDDYDSKLEAIYKAHRMWSLDKRLSETPAQPKDDKKAIQEVITDAGLSKGKEKTPETPKKSIMPKRQAMEDWYK